MSRLTGPVLTRVILKPLQGSVTLCRTAAVNVLLAGLALRLLVFVKDPANFTSVPSPATQYFLLLVSYNALVSYCVAPASLLVSLIRPARAAGTHEDLGGAPTSELDLGTGKSLHAGATSDTLNNLLVESGVGDSSDRAIIHCLICLMTGMSSTVLQIIIYVLLEESIAVQVTMACVTVFAVFPLLFFLFKLVEGRTESVQ